jgi:uncharacterized protein
MASSTFFRKFIKKLLLVCGLCFVLINAVAFMHAYKFTHFVLQGQRNVSSEDDVDAATKIKLAISGVNIPQPYDSILPSYAYEVVHLPTDTQTECWLSKMPKQKVKGTVVICHGYAGSKGGMLGKAAAFHQLGYNTLLIDFRGTKSSGTNNCTVGYKESAEVYAAVKYLRARGEQHIICFGTSMGAVAIIKAEHDSALACDALILECPFGSLYQTVRNRFIMQGVPAFPMANLMVFWGGVQNGFNGFAFTPIDYAKKITCPVLLMSGGKDKKVSATEINAIYNNLQGKKQLHLFTEVGHNDFLNKARQEWMEKVSGFLKI